MLLCWTEDKVRPSLAFISSGNAYLPLFGTKWNTAPCIDCAGCKSHESLPWQWAPKVPSIMPTLKIATDRDTAHFSAMSGYYSEVSHHWTKEPYRLATGQPNIIAPPTKYCWNRSHRSTSCWKSNSCIQWVTLVTTSATPQVRLTSTTDVVLLSYLSGLTNFIPPLILYFLVAIKYTDASYSIRSHWARFGTLYLWNLSGSRKFYTLAVLEYHCFRCCAL
jgi:hypothetical protein